MSTVRTSSTLHETVAALSGVTKRYRSGVLALNDLSLTLRTGEIVALLGPNGAGKSTVVKLLLGLGAPTTGAVHVFGGNPRLSSNRLRIGAMLQVGRAPETLRVREHIDLFRGYFPAPVPAADLIRLAGLEDLEERFFGQLSGGQKQRVLFALALAGDPDLIFLDEPTVGLDIESRRAMWKQIRALAARGKTVLLTTHYLEEADALASRIVVINGGRLVCEGTPAEVKARGAAAVVPAQAEHFSQQAASGVPLKQIRCTTTLARKHLTLMPGVTSVEQPPRELDTTDALPTTVVTSQPEATLREMLALDPTLTDLEIGIPALEDAFLALTATPFR